MSSSSPINENDNGNIENNNETNITENGDNGESIDKKDDNIVLPYENDEEEANYLRFIMELEFIQCLSNPRYLNYLAQNRYFQDKAFVNYLVYLQYWKKPEYAKFIVYPQSLYFLDLLQEERFRQELNHSQSTDFIHEQQFYHWQYYRNNRMSIKEQELQQQQQQQQQQQVQPPTTV
ncbi:hypothetical protein DDB_G0285221 [Dictyostelium discoideum AX4]|uniref:Putative mediator of RNA polymerase II transcription subunit 31 n=1 Tax=Dictyostelium discoideum TaxID=44689 RepID=MED31_DICDI|nr:hypothetical protein DDB_G0285221 [Dictyostelium discoideum AX4]Q54NI7.1 RecName: Full=Putative mediator of RNA polymerase II transcription subunit 31; AltName: Full=Putative mediator complex subunit 31 [Dictyostelium discoideum]EAL64822.1 hypothetical protein DDB_G0285221 [Dictyostelium discoideum AX4]|eukprot:XP_638330.1 hypothetical protein DDB_G0285221 [Dictyostelium discoideum AX4]